ncbi:polysaccharide export protein [bacterium]|jgi:polysaccharide export outer membrane protein|nr:polysaccharide export protein [bacterium]MDC0292750.1 polysaccharide export protein [Verrucomicrobiota bacterium]
MSSLLKLQHIISIGILLSFGGLKAQSRVASDYKIQPEDVLRILVFDEPSLAQEGLRVSGTGNITFPLLKDIPVEGRTTEEIEQDIERRLRDGYLKEPSVSVFVIVYNEQSYTIMGEVMIDGIYPLPSEKKIDLVEAIANAKGFTPNAKDSRIELFRDGEKRVFDFNDLFKIKDPEKKIFIQPGDKIKVPARFF